MKESIFDGCFRDDVCREGEECFKKTLFPRRFYVDKELKIYLTSAEVQCLKMLISNQSVFEIAKRLNKTERTVRAHIESSKTKLNAKTLFELGYRIGKLSCFDREK